MGEVGDGHKIIKNEERQVKVGIGNLDLAKFLSISQNQTKFLQSVCHSCFNLSSVFRKAINLYTF
jgi:hypothetical protein